MFLRRGGAGGGPHVSNAAAKPSLEHERLVDGLMRIPPRHVVAQAFVGGEGAGAWKRWWRWPGAPASPALGGHVRLALPLLGSSLSWGAGGRLQPTSPPGVVMPPSPLHLQERNGQGHAPTLGPQSSGGTDKSIRFQPLPTRAAINGPPRTESQRDAPCRPLHHDHVDRQTST